MVNIFKNIFKSKKGSVVGIDIGSSSIKLVQLGMQGGRPVLETYGQLGLGPYGGVAVGNPVNLSPQRTAEALIDLIRESKITAKVAGLAIPFGSSLISTLTLPVLPEKQLAQMIPLEAKKYIPVPMEDVTLDWMIVPQSSSNPSKTDEPKLNILLIAINNDVLARYNTIVNQAALETQFFEIEIFSAIRALTNDSKPKQLIIDIGVSLTKIYVAEEGTIRFSHSIKKGSENPGALDSIFSEASQVLQSYERKQGTITMPDVLLIGGGALLPGAIESAQKLFKNGVSIGDPFANVQTPPVLQELLKKAGPEFAVALGVALRALEEEK